MADAIMKAFKAKPDMYQIRINSRKAMEELLVKNGFVMELAPKIIALMDKLEKPDFAKTHRLPRIGAQQCCAPTIPDSAAVAA